MSKFLLSLTVIILSCNLFGQEKLTFRQVDKMDRLSIIQLAKGQLNDYLKLGEDSSFDYSLIDTTRILKNKKEYQVQFQRNVIFVPLNSNYYYGFTVDLLKNEVHRILVLNNGTTSNPIQFYNPTKQDLDKIKFVQKALELGVNIPITIIEKETFYIVGYQSSTEKVDKISGKIYDHWEEMLYLDPDKTFFETKFK